MREEAELSISELRQKRQDLESSSTETARDYSDDPQEEEVWARTRRRGPEEPWRERMYERRALPYEAPVADDDSGLKLPFDVIRILDTLKKRWFLCLSSAVLFTLIGFTFFFIGAKSMVQVNLVRREAPALFGSGEERESFQPQNYTDQTLVSLMQSPEIVHRVATKANPPIHPAKLARSLMIWQAYETDLVTIQFKAKVPPQRAAELVNLYAEEAVQYMRDLQTRQAHAINSYLSNKVESISAELASLSEQLKKLPAESRAVDTDKLAQDYLAQLAKLELDYELARIDLEASNPIVEKLQLAREELAELLLRYTDEHPDVQKKRATIKAFEDQLARATDDPELLKAIPNNAPPGTGASHFTAAQAQRRTMAKQVEQLKMLRESTQQKLNALLSEKDLNYAMLKNRYQSLDRMREALATRQREAQMFQESAPGYYDVVSPATIDRVSTRSHLKKTLIFMIMGGCFGLVLSAGFVVGREILDDRIRTAADLERVTELPVLATLGDLNKMDAAAQAKWAFRTWTILKGKLTRSDGRGFVCGFISANPGEGRSTWIKLLVNTANQRGLRVLTIATKPTHEPPVHPHDPATPQMEEKPPEEITTLSHNVLASPAQVTKTLIDPNNTYPVVHIPLPGWVWNLERRRQWQDALAHWRKIENLVLLVELPPACEPEAVLLAEKLPQVVWLCDSGKVKNKETRMHLETLRHGNCNLVGAVLNREPESFLREQLSRWFTIGLLLLGLASPLQAETEEADEPAGAQNIGFSVVGPHNRADWQKRLTLGPGDIVNLSFYGETNLSKTEVAIGPDGRISYLQAHEVLAAGLTVDELRAKLDQELSKYYRAPRTIVTPVAFLSKKYYVLGKVMNRGVFTLDRPTTVVEALARARGIETALWNRNSIDLADLQRSFLIRGGQRIPLDFEKLFNDGDLSQNIQIEPEDYIYIPAANLKEVYVVGEVNSPGIVIYTDNTSVVAAISERGGFAPRSFKSRVLVVRGSLNKPETFVIDTLAILEGRSPDFRLEPRDIVYVGHRPFIRAEELLDIAASAFIQSAVTGWAGEHVGPFFTRPVIRGL